MAGLEYILNAIKQLQHRAAVEGVMRPREKTAYELGRLSGHYEGLQAAHDIIVKSLRDDEEKLSE